MVVQIMSPAPVPIAKTARSGLELSVAAGSIKSVCSKYVAI